MQVPGRPLGLELTETQVFEPSIRARLGTTAQFCKVIGIRGTLRVSLKC